jgi:ferric-dicitrate binding protein FerR (iron transport regulator)
LPDGSRIWINAGSALEYATGTARGKDMLVKLSGEAYFEVDASVKRRFLVETRNMTVVATGTTFNVSAYESDSIASVTLIEGAVDVRMNNGSTRGIKPNEKLDLNLMDNTVNVFETNTYKWYAWKDNRLVFRDDPLSYVFKRLEQIYNLEFVYNPEDIDSHLYRATFCGESCDEIMKLLALSAPLEFSESHIQIGDVYQKRKIVVTARK